MRWRQHCYENLRQHGKERPPRQHAAATGKARLLTEASRLAICAACGKTRWFHEQSLTWRADDGHAFVANPHP